MVSLMLPPQASLASDSSAVAPPRRDGDRECALLLHGFAAFVLAASRRRFQPKSRLKLSSKIITSVTADAGSPIKVVKTNVKKARPVVTTPSTRTLTRAPVSERTRKCPTVTRKKMSNAAALPMEAMAVKLNPTASTQRPRR